jgi:hypothetical protein
VQKAYKLVQRRSPERGLMRERRGQNLDCDTIGNQRMDIGASDQINATCALRGKAGLGCACNMAHCCCRKAKAI